MATISTLAYKIVADTQNFLQGVRLSRTEMRAAQQVFRDSIDPITAHKAELDALAQLHQKGAISAAQYAAAQQRVNDQFRDTAAAEARKRLDAVGEAAGQVTVFGAGLTAAFGGTAYAAINAAAEYEQTTIAFTTLMGSADAARRTLEDLTNFAASTPFEMPQLQTVARGLLGFGITGRPMIEQLRMMGDAAAATGTDLAELGKIFVKIRGAGRLMGDSFAQLSERGVLFHRDIAQHFGIAESEVAKFISAGKVGFADVEAIMRSLTSEGGRYNDAMKAQSESALGLASTLTDNLKIALRGIGEELLPLTKSANELALSLVASFNAADPAMRKAGAGVVAVGAGLGSAATAVAGTVFVGLKAVETWGKMTTTLAGLSATSQTAALALGGLRLAKSAGAAGFVILAAAASTYAGLKLGEYLQGQTKAGQDATRVYDGLRSSMEAISTLDFTGVATVDLEQYIQSTERQIAKIQEHNAQLTQGQAWYNFWQRNSDLVGVNTQQIETLQAALEQAKKAQLEIQAPPPVATGPSAETLAAAEKYVEGLRQQNQLFGYSAEQARLYQMQLDGVPPAIIAAAAAEVKRAEALKAGAKAADEQMAAFRKSQEDYRKQRESIAATIAAYEQQTVQMQLSGDALESYKLAQAGATEAELAQLAALQAQRAAVQSQLDEATAARQRQEALRGDLDETTARLREQIATYGMTSDEIERYRLSQAGASADELAAIKALQDQLAALQAQKDAMRASDTTIGAGSLADAYDAIQRAQEAMTVTAPPAIVDRYAGYGPSVPVEVPEMPVVEMPPVEMPPVELRAVWADIPLPPIATAELTPDIFASLTATVVPDFTPEATMPELNPQAQLAAAIDRQTDYLARIAKATEGDRVIVEEVQV